MNTTQSPAKGDGVWSWIVIILVAALVVAWGLVAFMLVRDVPRTWHRGALPDTPSESIYSTSPAPDAANPPPQIQPLPEAKPKQAAPTKDTGGRP